MDRSELGQSRCNLRVGVAFFVATITGCSTVIVEPKSIGGSKADGIVEVGFRYGGFDLQEGDWEAGQRNAEKSCQGWGYASAEPFGEPDTRCEKRGEPLLNSKTNTYREGSCLKSMRVAKFQCVN